MLTSYVYKSIHAAEFYLVSIDGGEMVTVPAPLRYDLGPLNITDGNHRFDVQAGNVWGSSEPSPLDFTKTPVSDVTGLGLSSE